jgi:hypothetical protein
MEERKGDKKGKWKKGREKKRNCRGEGKRREGIIQGQR